MSGILNSAILDSAILNKKKTSFIHSDSSWCWQPILNSTILDSDILHKNFTHTLSPILMMAAILNSAILDSATVILDSNTLLSSLRFNQKHSHSTLTLTQTNSIWLKLIHSHLTSWWKPCWIVPSLIQTFWTNKILHSFLVTQLDDVQASWTLPYWIQPFWTKKNFTHSFWLILMMAAILNSTFLESAILNKKLLSFILTHLDDGSRLGFCHLGFRHLVIFSQIHSETLLFSTLTLTQTNSIWLKLIHSHSTWWCQASWILPSWIQSLWWQKKDFIHEFWLILMLAGILNSTKLGLKLFWKSDFKLIYSDSSWWWQPSWNLPSWIQLLPSWIQTPCYLLSDSLKNTLTPIWLSLKLNSMAAQTHWILTQLDDSSHLAHFTIMNFAILDSAILVFPLKLTHTCQDWFPPFAHKKTSLIHSDSTWWWQPS